MNDNNAVDTVRDSLTTARDSLTGVYMTTPLDTIVRHGRARRRRHGFTGLAGAVAVAVGTVLAVTTLLPASHQLRVQLAAWTVIRQPGGDIRVTIRELHNPAGLQAKLRADGVPATVTFIGQQNRACHRWPGVPFKGVPTPAGIILFYNVFPWPPPGALPARAIVIRPSALPRGGGVLLTFGPANSLPEPRGFFIPDSTTIVIVAGLVRTSPQCTGS
jgi:hypothetical protein